MQSHSVRDGGIKQLKTTSDLPEGRSEAVFLYIIRQKLSHKGFVAVLKLLLTPCR